MISFKKKIETYHKNYFISTLFLLVTLTTIFYSHITVIIFGILSIAYMIKALYLFFREEL